MTVPSIREVLSRVRPHKEVTPQDRELQPDLDLDAQTREQQAFRELQLQKLAELCKKNQRQ